MTPSGMMQRYWWRRALVMRSLLGRDRPRRIDRLIDYFGETLWREHAVAFRPPRYVPWRKTS